MIVSWNWLAEYLRLDVSVDELADRLALSGLNHESTTDVNGDLAIDLEVTSNRPDCLSHLGVAREISVLTGRELRPPALGIDPRARASADALGIRLFNDTPGLCPMFSARVVEGIEVGPSPWWLRRRLETVGLRSINNVVDVTNYVLFECGQPLHAFDRSKVVGDAIGPRMARPGEVVRGLNGSDYKLTAEMLVIADAENPLSLAGIMGGESTEIRPGTTDVFIEAARFDPIAIRRTARALGVSSDSSYRFERAIDPDRTLWASARCAELIVEVAGGSIRPGVLVTGDIPSKPAPVTLRFDQVARILGISIDPAEIRRILVALGLEVKSEADRSIEVEPPTWRSDLEREVDLIEEVARIHGYDKIPEDRPVPLVGVSRGRRERVEDAARSLLTGLGFDEAVTLSFVSEDLVGPIEGEPASPPIRVEHSVRKRSNILRQSLLPSLLQSLQFNEAHGNPGARLFEVAHVYLPRAGRPLPDEPARLAVAMPGDFFALKGVLEALLERFHIESALRVVARKSSKWHKPGRSADLLLGDAPLGTLGEFDRKQLNALDLKGEYAGLEVSIDLLTDRANLSPTFRPLPPFPGVSRDLSLVVSSRLEWADLAETIRGASDPTLESVQFLDSFAGGNLAEGQQSVHLGLRYRHPSRTMTGDEVEQKVRAALQACEAAHQAQLRS